MTLTHNESLDKLNQMWHKWNNWSGMTQHLRFGQYVLNESGHTRPDIFYETNAQLAYDKLYQEVVSGNLVL